jgi:NAD-dependent dihydropyrimidine dehydrogenase PreA subunit
MPYVIADACIDVKDRACLDACPVDCIYEGGRTLYIQPDECIDCGLCETVCPVAAIHADDRLPEELQAWIAINRDFFGPDVTGWGKPGGADERHRTTLDHPAVAQWPEREEGGSVDV